MKRSILALALLAAATPANGCEVAKILFGDIQLDIITYPDYETAIVRHANFKNDKMTYGTIKGEITVDRGSFAVRKIDQEVVGTISPSLVVEGDGCSTQARVLIRRVQRNVFTIVNGDTPVGTIQGRFPKNSFGVK